MSKDEIAYPRFKHVNMGYTIKYMAIYAVTHSDNDQNNNSGEEIQILQIYGLGLLFSLYFNVTCVTCINDLRDLLRTSIHKNNLLNRITLSVFNHTMTPGSP